MAQRNMLLMVIAVGCGLGAAFLTTRISAKPKIEQIEVYVAAKNLPVGTILSKDDKNNLVVKKAVPKDALPPLVITNEEDLLDRRLTRSIQAGEFITSNALTKGSVITLPDGMDMVTLPVNTTAAVAGFVGPGTRVDVLATFKQGNRLEAFPLLVNMLVLAVDTHASYESAANKGGGAFTNVSSVSFAVTQEQALILKMAEHAGCHLSLLLRNPNKKDDEVYNVEEVKKRLRALILPSRVGEGEDEGATPPMPPSAPKVETVKVWVANEELAAGTLLTK
ncbi:MAG: Flp pilus assembly protein CpaB, partial [Gemmataceae bacterium]|nr:Flp pilus assembly protein CpaB [Gemmataceae bacterium]